MNQVLQTIIQRRSCRKFTGEPLRREQLAQILEAGRWAPTGGNCQTVHFLVIQDHKTRSELRTRVQSAFARMEWREDLYSSLKNSIRRSRMGLYDYDYRAPVLVIAANRRGYPNAMADCACALQNIMLAATSLGLGSCWINQLHWLDDNPEIHRYLESLGLGAEETVCGAVALGHWDGPIPQPLQRTGMPVTWVSDPHGTEVAP